MLVNNNPFEAETLPLVEPGKYDASQDADFVGHINQLAKEYVKLRRAEIDAYVVAICPYQLGQVLDVDISYLGRRRSYFKGAKRFVIQGFEPFFWADEYTGKASKFWLNLHGVYLGEDNKAMLPEMVNGMPLELSPEDTPLEKIGFNIGGHNASILGISENQQHNYDEILEKIRLHQEEQKRRRDALDVKGKELEQKDDDWETLTSSPS